MAATGSWAGSAPACTAASGWCRWGARHRARSGSPSAAGGSAQHADRNFAALLQLIDAVGDHHIAGLESTIDGNLVAFRGAGDYVAHFHRVVLLHPVHKSRNRAVL